LVKPWIQVLANRFKEAEMPGRRPNAQPENFYRITFFTEGLKRVLTTSLQRLAGTGGDPVIGLQTSFGGGKTHTMLAVYHLARVADLKAPGRFGAAGRGRRRKDLEAPQGGGLRRLIEGH
jgi:predicted AAA+ superfamily ATPase